MDILNLNYNANINNLILNNTIVVSVPACSGGNTCSVINISVSLSLNINNLFFINNYIKNNSGAAAIGCGYQATNSCPTYNGSVKHYYNLYSSNPIYTNIGTFVVGNRTGSATVDSYGKSIDPLFIDQGSPSLQYYDIDLTRNDIGTYGGPYSIDNYWNTANGRARVYDLNMPFEIWNGSTPSIKAEGIHIK